MNKQEKTENVKMILKTQRKNHGVFMKYVTLTNNQLTLGKLHLIYFKHELLMFCFYKKLHFTISFAAIAKLRLFFPYFMHCSFFGCDSARYFSGRKFFAWNSKDLSKKQCELDRYSDGTLFTNIGLFNYLHSILRDRRKIYLKRYFQNIDN